MNAREYALGLKRALANAGIKLSNDAPLSYRPLPARPSPAPLREVDRIRPYVQAAGFDPSKTYDMGHGPAATPPEAPSYVGPANRTAWSNSPALRIALERQHAQDTAKAIQVKKAPTGTEISYGTPGQAGGSAYAKLNPTVPTEQVAQKPVTMPAKPAMPPVPAAAAVPKPAPMVKPLYDEAYERGMQYAFAKAGSPYANPFIPAGIRQWLIDWSKNRSTPPAHTVPVAPSAGTTNAVPKQQSGPLPSSVRGVGSSVTGATGTDATANGTTG